tara:strand:- start:5171 stop:6757 length:1587 start_codon:yes stop_codon:yes gene_type:complete
MNSETNPVFRGRVSAVGEGLEQGQQLRIEAFAQSDGWSLVIKPTEDPLSGDFRLKEALARLVTLDYGVTLALRRKGSFETSVPMSPGVTTATPAAVESLIPLLMPPGVDSSIFAYQERGVEWLLSRPRGILADDMGLGKTAQALTAARHVFRSGDGDCAVIAAPRSLVHNWLAEATKWAPELSARIGLPSKSDKDDWWRNSLGRVHLIITSYEQLREPPECLCDREISLLITDEAHRLRKSESLAHQGLRQLSPSRFWALSGTPIENDADDIATIMSLLEPKQFDRSDSRMSAASLRASIKPYVLRRSKADVLKDLPEVIESTEVLPLSERQSGSYKEAVLAKRTSPNDFLALFNKLRQICDIDPITGESSKLDRIIELLNSIKEAGEKGIVFSYQRAPLEKLRERLSVEFPEISFVLLTGDHSLEERAEIVESFKLDPDCTVLLASTRVASEGLTLTEANHVFFINRWWNPSANDQARDRVVRIGQQKTVWVKSFVSDGTVESRLEDLLEEKGRTFDELIEELSTEI